MTSQSHLVLARKYRPKILSELVGQDVFVKTISNAITTNKIHHAFLLTGTRGAAQQLYFLNVSLVIIFVIMTSAMTFGMAMDRFKKSATSRMVLKFSTIPQAK